MYLKDISTKNPRIQVDAPEEPCSHVLSPSPQDLLEVFGDEWGEEVLAPVGLEP